MTVFDLNEQDRVILYCPKAKLQKRKLATFIGISTVEEILAGTGARMLRGSENTWKANSRYADFIQTKIGPVLIRHQDGSTEYSDKPVTMMHTCLEVTEHGNLQDVEGRTVYIERRIHGGN